MTTLDFGSLFELFVILFQVQGVLSLCCYRLMSLGSFSKRARLAFVLALVGLGVSGSLCATQDSEFALFGGASMTILIMGMIGGGCPVVSAPPAAAR